MFYLKYQKPYVFINRAGDARGYCTESIRKAILRAGIQNGMSVYEVCGILGHGYIKTTMRYDHLEQKQVATKAMDVIDWLNGSRGVSSREL